MSSRPPNRPDRDWGRDLIVLVVGFLALAAVGGWLVMQLLEHILP